MNLCNWEGRVSPSLYRSLLDWEGQRAAPIFLCKFNRSQVWDGDTPTLLGLILCPIMRYFPNPDESIRRMACLFHFYNQRLSF